MTVINSEGLNGAVTNPLQQMTANTQTALWNDSATFAELQESISFGAVGATCNPVIALAAIRADLPRWARRIGELSAEQPSATESQIGWRLVEEISVEAARLLEPAFTQSRGRNGRLSIQTDPRNHRDADALVAQAVHFSDLAPNIIVKIPATAVGLRAIEEAVDRGVMINVTVSFSVAQAVAAAEAIERGMERRSARGESVDDPGHVVTIMCGRLDDWLKDCYAREGLCFDPGYLEWSGIAAFKNAYRIFAARGFRSRLLSAAYRNCLQWTEFVGGDVVLSPPFAWQQRFVNSGIDPVERMHLPVDPNIVQTLYEQMPEFRKAYDVDGMAPDDFADFGASRKTLRQFLQADADLDAIVRDVLIPAP